MRLGLLECDHVDDRNKDVAGDYRDMFAALLTRAASDLELLPYDVVGGEVPSSPDECDGWLATGSRRSVFDDVEWIERASAFVRDLHNAQAPYVGVCFGHQLLARSLGGHVERSPRGWGVGTHRLRVRETAAWMQPPERDVDLLFMHQDQVTQLPESAVLVGTSDHCPLAMFRVGTTMLGIQAHPEFDPRYLERLLRERVGRIGREQTNEARASLDTPLDNDIVAHWVVRFLDDGSRDD